MSASDSKAAQRAGPERSLRRARLATAVMFFSNGALFATLIPRLPEIKSHLGMSAATYGFALAGFPAGALLAGLLAGALIRKYGSANVAVGGSLLLAAWIVLAGTSPSAWVFAGAMLAAGAADAIADVAQNAHGLEVQRRLGRSILNSLHAIWSVGAVAGGLLSAGAVRLGIPLTEHLAASGLVLSAAVLLVRRWGLPASRHRPVEPEATEGPGVPGRRVGRTRLILLAIACIAISNAVVEDAGTSWAALYLRDEVGASGDVAAFGFVALVGAQFIGRLAADPLVDRLGYRLVVRAGGVLVILGMGTGLVLPTVTTTIVGFAACGLGIAAFVPAALQTASEIPEKRPGANLTLVSWLMRVGFVSSAPVVGILAEASSLRVALALVPAVAVLVLLLSRALAGRR